MITPNNKKKRGRPPKKKNIQINNNENENTQIIVKKKRGRPKGSLNKKNKIKKDKKSILKNDFQYDYNLDLIKDNNEEKEIKIIETEEIGTNINDNKIKNKYISFIRKRNSCLNKIYNKKMFNSILSLIFNIINISYLILKIEKCTSINMNFEFNNNIANKEINEDIKYYLNDETQKINFINQKINVAVESFYVLFKFGNINFSKNDIKQFIIINIVKTLYLLTNYAPTTDMQKIIKKIYILNDMIKIETNTEKIVINKNVVILKLMLENFISFFANIFLDNFLNIKFNTICNSNNNEEQLMSNNYSLVSIINEQYDQNKLFVNLIKNLKNNNINTSFL